MKFLSQIALPPTLHRLCTDFGTEEERRIIGGRREGLGKGKGGTRKRENIKNSPTTFVMRERINYLINYRISGEKLFLINLDSDVSNNHSLVLE